MYDHQWRCLDFKLLRARLNCTYRGKYFNALDNALGVKFALRNYQSPQRAVERDAHEFISPHVPIKMLLVSECMSDRNQPTLFYYSDKKKADHKRTIGKAL